MTVIMMTTVINDNVLCNVVAVYVIEAGMKICGFGPSKYFSSGWNM